MKIVINTCYGGFGLSDEAIARYSELAGLGLEMRHNANGLRISDVDWYLNGEFWYYGNLERNDPILVQVVEEMGHEADGGFAKLKVVDVPDDVDWEIDEYDGVEHVAERARKWY